MKFHQINFFTYVILKLKTKIEARALLLAATSTAPNLLE